MSVPYSDKFFQCLATGQWFSPGPLVSSTNKTDRHDITEILLKVALSTITSTPNAVNMWVFLEIIILFVQISKKEKKCSSHFLMFMMISTSIKINKMNISMIISKKKQGKEETKPCSVSDCCLTPIFQLFHGEHKLFNTGWLGIRIMCPSGVTCISMDCCFSDLAL
jgi:hypothetical protein